MALYFAADRTLGKLAKWLRILGFDTTFEIEVPAGLFYENLEKDRIVLTRTGTIKKQFSVLKRGFVVKIGNSVLSPTKYTEDCFQLAQLMFQLLLSFC